MPEPRPKPRSAHSGGGESPPRLPAGCRRYIRVVPALRSPGLPRVFRGEVILGELSSFGAGLETKPMVMVASKIDVANPEKLAKLKRWATRKKLKLYPISAVTGEGIDKLKFAMAKEVERLRGVAAAERVEEKQEA